MKERDRIAATLAGIDCGACGSPPCATFAEDVVIGDAEEAQCVFVHERHLVDHLARITGPGARLTDGAPETSEVQP